MKPIASVLVASISLLGLAACSSESEEPVEQIVIREPGDAASAVAGTASDTDSGDLVAMGKSAFAVCAACHSVEQGVPSRAGPNLYGVVGRAAGALDDFRYSDAMANSGLTWDEAELDAFLANPSAKVAGTSMVAGAVRDADRRAAITAYLASLPE